MIAIPLAASASRQRRIDSTLYDAFGQRQVSTMYKTINQYFVVMEIDPQFQSSPDGLNNIYLRSTITGKMVPLPAFTHFAQSDYRAYRSLIKARSRRSPSPSTWPRIPLWETRSRRSRTWRASWDCQPASCQLPGNDASLSGLFGFSAIFDLWLPW